MLRNYFNIAIRKEPMSVILSQTAAKKYFGDGNPMGQQVQLTGGAVNATVTGIMKDIPANSQVKADMLISMSSYQKMYGYPTSDSEWTNHNFYTYLLLKPNANAKSLEAKLPTCLPGTKPASTQQKIL